MRNIEAEQTVLALALALEEGDKEAFDALWNEERSAEEWKQIAGQAIKVLRDAVDYFEGDVMPEAMEFAREPALIKRELEQLKAYGWDVPEPTFDAWFRHKYEVSSPADALKGHLKSVAREAADGHDSWSLEEVMAQRLERGV